MHSGNFTAVLDANVLYPAPVRDILLSLADQQLYRPKWSDIIHQEWKRNLIIDRPDVKTEQIDKTIWHMNKAFPDAEVSGFSSLINSFNLPDEDDRHVLAAGIRANADAIITFNLSDFPVKTLMKYDIESVHPDQFIVNLIELDQDKSINAFKELLERLKNPPLTGSEVLKSYKKCGLFNTAKRYGKLALNN